jgi:hypothetical protein
MSELKRYKITRRSITKLMPGKKTKQLLIMTMSHLSKKTRLMRPHAKIREGGCDIHLEDVHHGTDVRQNVKAAEVCDDPQAGGRDECDKEKLFEAVTEVQAFDVQQDVEAAEVRDDA